jgi:hypothetical protein
MAGIRPAVPFIIHGRKLLARQVRYGESVNGGQGDCATAEGETPVSDLSVVIIR